MVTIIDTDALLGLFNTSDIHHERALHILSELVAQNATTFILPTTLCEFALLASSRIGGQITQQIISTLRTDGYLSIDITDKITTQAVDLYQKQTSKEESLFDCYVMVGALDIRADCIFSFDTGYRKNGFKLAQDILK